MRVLFLISIILFVIPLSIFSLSCLPCDPNRCPRRAPGCCASGVYAKDACGCCAHCPQEEGEPCGGPWNRNGTCAPGLFCAARCPCITRVKGRREKCVFPFIYKGQKYHTCTTVHANRAWCATRVDHEGQVVSGHWGDCHPRDCPSETEPCFNHDEPSFQEVGICVTATVKSWIQRYYTFKARFEVHTQISHFLLNIHLNVIRASH